LEQCKAVVQETGCWLYLGAQHVSGTYGLTNYASPCLRREAKQELAEIQNSFNMLVNAIMKARRKEAAGLALELEKTRKSAQEEAERTSLVLAEQEAQMKLKDEYIAKLQALVRTGGDA
jgi:hypothetical protein